MNKLVSSVCVAFIVLAAGYEMRARVSDHGLRVYQWLHQHVGVRSGAAGMGVLFYAYWQKRKQQEIEVLKKRVAELEEKFEAADQEIVDLLSMPECMRAKQEYERAPHQHETYFDSPPPF